MSYDPTVQVVGREYRITGAPMPGDRVWHKGKGRVGTVLGVCSLDSLGRATHMWVRPDGWDGDDTWPLSRIAPYDPDEALVEKVRQIVAEASLEGGDWVDNVLAAVREHDREVQDG